MLSVDGDTDAAVEARILVSFIKMHKGQLTTYNASRANKINIVWA